MEVLSYTHSSTSVVLNVTLYDSESNVGAGLTGLAFDDANLMISTIASTEAAPTDYKESGSNIETISTLGTYAAPTASKARFKEVDATDQPGVYQIQLADARFAVASATSLLLVIKEETTTALNLAEKHILILLPADVATNVSTILTRIGTPANIDSGGATISDNLKKMADDNDGATFDATLDSLNIIKSTIGVPANIDSGGATLSGNLKKLADDNDGADYDATTDSQKILSDTLGTPANIDSGGATISDNLKKMADDNGGADFDATVDSLNKIQSTIVSSVPVNNVATGQNVTSGTIDAGGWANTAADDGSYFQLSPTGAASLDVDLEFNIGADRPAEVLVNGYWNGGGAWANVYAYDYINSVWQQISDSGSRMNSTASDQDYLYILTANHVDSNGDVKIRWLSSSITAGHNLYLDQVIVKSIDLGFTPSEIAEAVAMHDVSDHSNHDSLGFRVSLSIIDEYAVSTSDTASSFTCSTLPATADYYNYYYIRVHDVTNDRYADSWILDMTNGGVVTLGRALPWTPDTSSEIYILASRVTPEEVNIEMEDVLTVDTQAEEGIGAPPVAPTFKEMLMYLYMAFRNKVATAKTAETSTLYNDAGTAIAASDVSDDGDIFTKDKFGIP